MRTTRRSVNGRLVEFTINGVPQPLDAPYTPPIQRPRQPCGRFGEGAGTELQRILHKIGLKPKAGCKCNQRIKAMNYSGTEWCRANVDTIVGWLREEAKRSGLPFIAIGAKLLVRRAIARAEKKQANEPRSPINNNVPV